MNKVEIITEPKVYPVAQTTLMPEGLKQYFQDEYNVDGDDWSPATLPASDAAMLVELAGRGCYEAWHFLGKANQRETNEYIESLLERENPHLSVAYHPRFTFKVTGISRRVSHELIRHYVGAQNAEDGSPSQDSTRYIEHPGSYVAHPYILGNEEEMLAFKQEVQHGYEQYLGYISRMKEKAGGTVKGLEKKRIYESASQYLHHSCATSFWWSANPVALNKMFKERKAEAADLEFRRLAVLWEAVCSKHWPEFFKSDCVDTSEIVPYGGYIPNKKSEER